MTNSGRSQATSISFANTSTCKSIKIANGTGAPITIANSTGKPIAIEHQLQWQTVLTMANSTSIKVSYLQATTVLPCSSLLAFYY